MESPSPMTEAPQISAETPEAEPATEVPQRKRRLLLGQRRRFLIDWQSQLRSAAFVTGLALILVTLLNLSLHSARSQATQAMAGQSPQLRQILEAQARFELLLGILASLIFLAGIFVVTILETHKTAGAAYHLSRELERVRDGLYGIHVRLRKGDNLRDVAAAFNEMSRALAERVTLEVEELEHAASVADRIESPLEASALAQSLRAMADEHRRQTAGLGS